MNNKFSIPGIGSMNSQIMLIGEAGGATEDKQKIPFVGTSGKLLRSILNDLQIPIDVFYITNVVKFRPTFLGKNICPSLSDIKDQLIILFNEIQMLKKLKLIITLGSISTNTILQYIIFRIDKPISISKFRGKIFKYNDKIDIIPCFHPAFILRNRSLKNVFCNDLRNIKRYIK